MSRSFAYILAAAALVALTQSPAAADPIEGRTPVRDLVSYADLDLETEAGARQMLRRLSHAAAGVCRDAAGRDADVQVRNRMRQSCRIAALNQAVSQLDAPLVSNLFARSGRRVLARFAAN